MQEEEEEEPPQASANAAPTRKKSKPQTEADVEDRLLRWVQSTTEGQVFTNMTTVMSRENDLLCFSFK